MVTQAQVPMLISTSGLLKTSSKAVEASWDTVLHKTLVITQPCRICNTLNQATQLPTATPKLIDAERFEWQTRTPLEGLPLSWICTLLTIKTLSLFNMSLTSPNAIPLTKDQLHWASTLHPTWLLIDLQLLLVMFNTTWGLTIPTTGFLTASASAQS